MMSYTSFYKSNLIITRIILSINPLSSINCLSRYKISGKTYCSAVETGLMTKGLIFRLTNRSIHSPLKNDRSPLILSVDNFFMFFERFTKIAGLRPGSYKKIPCRQIRADRVVYGL